MPMSIFLLILKLSGLIVLFLLFLLLLLLLTVLFVPVHYELRLHRKAEEDNAAESLKEAHEPREPEKSIPESGEGFRGKKEGCQKDGGEDSLPGETDGRTEETAKYEFRISAGLYWILHLFRIKAEYSDELHYRGKLLCFTLFSDENIPKMPEEGNEDIPARKKQKEPEGTEKESGGGGSEE